MENKIIINKVSYNWEAGLPIGNGRLGAMVLGIPEQESISLNEDSLWYGQHLNRNNPDAKKYYKEIRKMLLDGRAREAEKLLYTAMTSDPKYFGAYEPMCDLCVFFNHRGPVSNYVKELDLGNAIAHIGYEVEGMKVHREHFVSNPHQVMVFRFTSDKPQLDVHINLMRRPCDNGTKVIDGNILHMNGQCGPNGIKFDCLVTAKTDGEMQQIGDFLTFKNATEIIIYVSANSDFYEKDAYSKSLEQLKEAYNVDYETLKKRHISDYKKLYDRVSVDFNFSSNIKLKDRIEKIQAGEKDPGLVELAFNYARYLMISASRSGTQAMNLQGIWNKQFAAPWECNYTLNINTEMNYWIAESTMLSECHEPLFSLIERMAKNGEITAKEIYGCEGFVGHHATNLWGDTAIQGISFPSSVWPMGGAWLCKHLWEHYLYTLDKEFLKKRAFPIMKRAALFFTQYLMQDEDGFYISGPSLSPENCFYTEDGTISKHCMAPEMDNQIMRSLFHSVLRSYEILECFDSEYEIFKNYYSHIRPTRINKNGGIMEWDKDYEEFQPTHRHLSPMFALYPDYQITPEKTPELAQACVKTLERRTSDKGQANNVNGGFAGWNGAWLSCCYSRLREGNQALEAIYNMLSTQGALSESMLSRYPIYQIDGNFGLGAAVVEMLLYSDEESIVILPALPDELTDGSFSGLCARGGFVIDAEWENKKLRKATLTSRGESICRIKADGLTGVDCKYECDGDYLVFKTNKDVKYTLEFSC